MVGERFMLNSNSDQIVEETILPVISAPMFLISGPDLVIEECKAGIIGSFPTLNARTPEILESWMARIKEELEQTRKKNPDVLIAPWAVNLIVHKTNTRYEADLDLVKTYQPPIVITSLGDPEPITEIVHAYGGLVFSDVSTLHHARRAAAKGVDGLILVCNGAGGHAGTINPMAFIASVKGFWNGITVLAGALSHGQDILAAEALGADFAYMGTRFIASKESLASDGYRKMLIDSNLEDLVYTDAISGVNANFLIPSIQNAGLDPKNLVKKKAMDFSNRGSEAKAWKDIWSAGQGVGSIKEVQPVAAIIGELRNEYSQARERLLKRGSLATTVE